MTVKVTMANGGSDSVDFINATGTTLAQVKAYDDGSSNGHLELYTTASGTASEKVRITSSGNVGIGTSSPSGKVSTAVADGSTNAFYAERTGASPATLAVTFANAYSNILSSGVMTFSTAGSERARIDSSGNLLVGTTSQSARFDVKGAGATGSTRAVRVVNSSDTEMFAILNSGEIYTGGAANSPYNATTGSAANLFVQSDGQLKRSTSSLKYKTDVKDVEHGLAKVMQLRAVTYKGINDGESVFGGLIAEEVHEAGLTEFVQYAEDGTPDALAYGQMVSLAFKAIQEQQAIITTLTERVAALENQQ